MKKEMVSQTWSFRRLRGTRARVLLEKWDGLEVVWVMGSVVVGLGVVGFGDCGCKFGWSARKSEFGFCWTDPDF
ncbi:unnamed protein product, partial [Linum tenue]